jgi:PAS domain S-box-containing protein
MNPVPKFSFLLSPSLPSKSKAGVLIAFLLLVIASIVSYHSYSVSVKETDEVNHTYEVKLKLEEFFSYVKDVNRGISGILLRKDYSFYATYKKGKADMYGKLDELQALTKDNVRQQGNLQKLKSIIDLRSALLDSVLQSYASHNETLLNQQLDRGRSMMDNTEKAVQEIRLIENNLLTERSNSSKNSIAKSKAIIAIFMVVAIVVIAICFFLLLHSLTIIQEKEKTYRNIFEHSKDLLCTCKQDLSIIEANPGFVKTFGFEKEDGKMLLSKFLAHADDVELVKTVFEKRSNLEQKQLVFIGNRGELHICQSSFILIDQKAKIYSVVLTDITQQVQAQLEKEALERFANIGKASRLLAHEVRNPLTNINLAVESLHDESKDENLNNYLSIIERNSVRINKIITELLNSTRPTVLEYGPMQVAAVMDEALAMAKDRINLKHIAINKHFQDNLPIIKGDKEKLGLAFLNIIINAIEAMPNDNGILELMAALDRNKNIVVSIKDNGIGMDAETINSVFRPFFSKKAGGTGLGLASTQNIVLTHKGKVEVSSEPGKGTIFTIILPTK